MTIGFAIMYATHDAFRRSNGLWWTSASRSSG